jgi:hypothetical protein
MKMVMYSFFRRFFSAFSASVSFVYALPWWMLPFFPYRDESYVPVKIERKGVFNEIEFN